MKKALIPIFCVIGIAVLAVAALPAFADDLSTRLRGKILLQVEDNGEAWYVNPDSRERFFLYRPETAFQVMREQGLGITNNDLGMIAVGLTDLAGPDTDGDGLIDSLEEALGTATDNPDSDGDGYSDKDEVGAGYNPLGAGRLPVNAAFAEQQQGKIFLQVERSGEAWWVNPDDLKRYYLGRPADAFNLMRGFGLGISNENLDSVPVAKDSLYPRAASGFFEIPVSARRLTEVSRETLLDTSATFAAELTVDPLGEHFYYIGQDSDGYRLMRNNQPVSDAYAKILTGSGVQISADSAHYGVIAQKANDAQVAVIDGVEGAEYHSISYLRFSSTAGSYRYIARTLEGQDVIVHNGAESEGGRFIDCCFSAPTFSPDGQYLAHLESDGGQVTLFKNGVAETGLGGPLADIDSLNFSPNSQHLVVFSYDVPYRDGLPIDSCEVDDGYDIPTDRSYNYVERQYNSDKGLYVIGDDFCRRFDNVNEFQYDVNGNHSFLFRTSGGEAVVRGGIEFGTAGNIYTLELNDTGTRVKYIVSAPTRGAGIDQKVFLLDRYIGSFGFSPDGERAIGTTSMHSTGYPLTSIFLDNRLSPDYTQVFRASYFNGSPAAIAKDGEIIYRIIFAD